jgi:mannose-6-phosphate isomerase-like protein (cupin superfamily)
MVLKTINVAQEASRLLQPFQMAHLGYVDDLAVSVFVCQGAIAWHRHVDQDELFLVQSGAIVLETEWGSTRLRPDEMAVVPKGVEHRSSSFLWSTVLLFRQQVMSDRKNGDRRTAALTEGGALHKISVAEAAKRLRVPFQPIELARVEESHLGLALLHGQLPWRRNDRYDELFFLFEGEARLGVERGTAALGAGEMAIVPGGMRYRLAASEPAKLLVFAKKTRIGADG